MQLEKYFNRKKGIGVFSSSDRDGKVTSAVFAKPHFVDEKTIAFIMSDHLTHENITSNPFASYMFLENGNYKNGKRLMLTKILEDENIKEISRHRRIEPKDLTKVKDGKKRFLVYFAVNQVLPLVGS